jgi:cell division protein FtsN
MASRPQRGGKDAAGAGSFFVVVGCLVVLGGTFVLGVMAGHYGPGVPFSKRETTAKAPRERSREREAPAAEAPPTLTFYQELTAPLTSPPPAKPPKPARVEKAEPPKTEAPTPEAGTPEPGKGFTVQVGAYRTREPAEALRVRLAAAGHDVHVVEADGAGNVRFRVRVGAFATREAAQEAAARIGADRSVSTFVTAR